MKCGTIKAMGFAGMGALLGFLAATRDFSPSSRASGPAPDERRAGAEAADGPASCSEGMNKSLLLAQAAPDATKAKAKAKPATAATGKKPNIVVIMGDDIGWFNIGAYHRGIMAGKTPNLDQLASPAA